MSIPKSSITRMALTATLKSVSCAIAPRLRARLRQMSKLQPGTIVHLPSIDLVQKMTLFAEGGYNSIWLVELHELVEGVDTFILRLPCNDALLPYQVTNEVAFRQFVAAKLPHIPVPRVFHYEATDHYESSFIAEEFIQGDNLSTVWMTLGVTQKEIFARKLAKTLVDLAEVQFDQIGGLDPEIFSPAPTVEGVKIFKGRGKFHSNDCYSIGPYRTTKEYILACYDREIYYYSHASAEDLDSDLFQDHSVQSFIGQLQERRRELALKDIADEPFVLVHGDFHARNVLVRNDQIVAILDWEFAGAYPLSETLSGGDVEVVDATSQELDEENTIWGQKIRDFLSLEVKSRGWHQGTISAILGDGNKDLGLARTEMYPS
ncbi:kinase-like domain-containing protein [Xylariaceae sp. FL1019]|nr:kinase-like domain-containing protein [Xylariaceae sp. FL1019]